MKHILLLFFSLLCTTLFCQENACLILHPEKGYPYAENDGKSFISWKFNHLPVQYQSGEYTIPVNPPSVFDTIEVISVYKTSESYPAKKRRKNVPVQDTSSRKILCKFQTGTHYGISQIYPGNFSVFSLDSFNIEQRINLHVSGFNTPDTLYAHINYQTFEITSDTTITYFYPNSEMRNQLVAAISMDTEGRKFSEHTRDQSPFRSIFGLNYLFLHGETLEIRVNIRQNTIQTSLL